MPATAYWFCPENDIALASGREIFTPPRQAALLGRYGAPLLWWMGTPDDIVLIPSDLTPEETDSLGQWEMQMKARFGAGPRLLPSLQGEKIDSLRPWGWSGYSARCLRRAGAPSHLLDEIRPGLDRLRQLSHRKSSVEITHRLDESMDFASFGIPPSVRPLEIHDTTEITSILSAGRPLIAKSPWSSSGRGVFSSRDMSAPTFLRRCDDTIRRQGSVMIEHLHQVVADFAMLFEATATGVTSVGLSRFHNCRGASYAGNDLATDAEIRSGLSSMIPNSLLEAVEESLRAILDEMTVGRYRGPLGVDMLIAAGPDGSCYIVPCVELNLRCTMGFVAHALRKRLPSAYRRMSVAPFRTGAPEMDPLPLVPPNLHFSIVAER